MDTQAYAIGVDIGGTGIKAAVVDTRTSRLVTERIRRATPRPATPSAVRETVALLAAELADDVPAGVAFPGVVQNGVVRTAANLDSSWIGISLPDLLGDILPRASYVNDADAAGIAETMFGSAHGRDGLVVVVTLGTGIGVALVHDQRLIPNAELGHVLIDGHPAETTTSARAREQADLDWETWARRVSRYIQHLEDLLSPELFVVGGGVSKAPDHWYPLIQSRTPIRLARLINNAGIVGAASIAMRQHGICTVETAGQQTSDSRDLRSCEFGQG